MLSTTNSYRLLFASDFGKRLSICNSIYVSPRNEIKRGVPILLIEIRGAKVHHSGAIFLLMKTMRRNCTTILWIAKSIVQKSGNMRKGEVTNTPDC